MQSQTEYLRALMGVNKQRTTELRTALNTEVERGKQLAQELAVADGTPPKAKRAPVNKRSIAQKKRWARIRKEQAQQRRRVKKARVKKKARAA